MNKLIKDSKRGKKTVVIVTIIGCLLMIGILFNQTGVFFKEANDIKEKAFIENVLEKEMNYAKSYTKEDYNLKDTPKWDVQFTKNLSTEEYNKYLKASVALRRNTYRGKNITEYYNDGSLYEMISKGTFDDIYVGDYIVANGVTWLVADIDNYLNSGDTSLTKHHVTIISSKPLMNIGMNATNTTEGGYYGSRMATETLPNLVSNDGVIGKAFGSHIIEYRNLLTNRVNTEAINQSGGRWAGASDEWAWYTRKVDLMSEVNVYGTTVFSSSGYDIGIDNCQYAIFQLKPEFINSYEKERFNYWLKAISGATRFAWVSVDGLSDGHNWGSGSSYAFGVRPRFLIG